MTICFNNQSELCIKIVIGESEIILPQEKTYLHSCSFDHMPIEIRVSISDSETLTFGENALCLNISTIILCDFTNSINPTLILRKKTQKFQNHTNYKYLTIDPLDLKIHATKHEIDNLEVIKNYVTRDSGQKKNNILYIVKKSLIDMLLDGLILSALFAWIFSWKVALATLLVVFSIALIINSIKARTSKSKHRFLNWDRDIDQPDDVMYFVANLEKYCN